MQEFFNLPVDENIKRGEFRYFIFGETLSEILGNMFTQNCVSKMFNPNLFTKKKNNIQNFNSILLIKIVDPNIGEE